MNHRLERPPKSSSFRLYTTDTFGLVTNAAGFWGGEDPTVPPNPTTFFSAGTDFRNALWWPLFKPSL